MRKVNPWTEKRKPYVWVSQQQKKSQITIGVEHLRPVEINDLPICLEAPAAAGQQAQSAFFRMKGNFFVLIAGNTTFNHNLDWAKEDRESALQHELWIVWDWSGCARNTSIDNLEDFASKYLDTSRPKETASQWKKAGLILWRVMDSYPKKLKTWYSHSTRSVSQTRLRKDTARHSNGQGDPTRTF